MADDRTDDRDPGRGARHEAAAMGDAAGDGAHRPGRHRVVELSGNRLVVERVTP